MVNVPQDVFQSLIIAQLKAGETVWFGNDVLEDMDRDSGTLVGDLYDMSTLFDVDLEMTKADRFATRQAHVSHAMTFTGVDLVNDQPTKWKVENSWGKDRGHDATLPPTNGGSRPMSTKPPFARICCHKRSKMPWPSRQLCCRPGTH